MVQLPEELGFSLGCGHTGHPHCGGSWLFTAAEDVKAYKIVTGSKL